MAAPIKHASSEKGRKKVLKKLRKLTETLKEKHGIACEDKPSRIICVCNGGLDNNVTFEEINNLFTQYDEKCDIFMLPQKSYCYVCCSDVEVSEKAVTNLNGYKLPANGHRKMEVVLYTLFVDKVPESMYPSHDRPPGLILLEDFITQEYADQIMACVFGEHNIRSGEEAALKHRFVKHYGYEFLYTINNVYPDNPLPDNVPDICKPLLSRLREAGHIGHTPDQLTVNQYKPGQGIPPHVDTPSAFEDGLVSLSVGSQVLMEFRHPDGRHLSVLLPNLSVLVMTGESRYVWSHGITPRKSDIIPSKEGGLTLSQRGLRTSFTFRKITGVRPENIDSAQPSVPTDNHSASQLESQHVHQVYEEIAQHFSGTRHTPWPHIADFLHEQAPGSLLADIGCGNGKYFGINKSLFELGSDRSFNLAGICKERGYQIYVGDVLAVPLRAGVFDVCLCIAVIHHMSTQERRQKAVAELLKILRPGGKALIYVWAIEQELNKIKSKYLKDKQNTQQLEERVSSQLLMKDTHPCASDIIDVNEDTNLDEKKHVNEQEVGYSKRDTGVINSALESKHTIQPLADMQSTQSSNDRYKMCDNDADRQVECCTSDDVLNSSSQAKDKPQKLEVHINRTCFKQQDVLVPWQLKSKTENQDADNLQNTFHRFYHVFRQGELEDLCRSVGCCKVLKSYYDQGNWAVIVEKQ